MEMKLPTLIKKQKKTSTGLYATLGVANDASTKEIQAAFRKIAKKHHPDHGGTEKDFTTLLNAYRILRDPGKRKLYDETGDTEETLVSNDYAAMTEGIMQLFQSVLELGLPEKPDIDLIEAMKQAIVRDIGSTGSEIEEINMNLQRLRELKRRLIRKTEGPNLFTNVLDEKINSLLKSEKSAKQRNRILLLAREELDNYTCITEIVDVVQYYSFSANSASTATNWNENPPEFMG